jgi:hypothetical protein
MVSNPTATDRVPEVSGGPKRRLSSLSLSVALAGLVLTGLLGWATATIHDHNEDRLLTLELHQAASVVTAAIPSIQIPMTSAAELADATNGDPQQFRDAMAPYVGGTRPFASASLWRLGRGTPTAVAVVGATPVLESTPGEEAAFLSEARRSAPFGCPQPARPNEAGHRLRLGPGHGFIALGGLCRENPAH